MVVTWSLALSHSGLFAVKIRQRCVGNRHWRFVLHLNQIILSTRNVFELLYCFGSHQSFVNGTKRTFTQSIHAKVEDALLLEILRTKRASITSGMFITRVLPALDAPITMNVFVFSMTLSAMAAISQNSWSGGMFYTRHQFQKTLMVLTNRGRLQIHWTWICHKAPQKMHVEVFHPSFGIDTVHNALETRTVLQCLPTHFVWLIIGIISRLRAAVFQTCTCRNWCRCFAWQSRVCLSCGLTKYTTGPHRATPDPTGPHRHN